MTYFGLRIRKLQLYSSVSATTQHSVLLSLNNVEVSACTKGCVSVSVITKYSVSVFVVKKHSVSVDTKSIVSVSIVTEWTSYQIRKIARCACAGNAGNVFPATGFKRKRLVSDHGMHHGTCSTHVPWCISVSLTRGGGETFPAHAQPTFLRIW